MRNAITLSADALTSIKTHAQIRDMDDANIMATRCLTTGVVSSWPLTSFMLIIEMNEAEQEQAARVRRGGGDVIDVPPGREAFVYSSASGRGLSRDALQRIADRGNGALIARIESGLDAARLREGLMEIKRRHKRG